MPSTIRIRRCGLAILGFVCRILIVFLLELIGLTRRQLKLVDHIDAREPSSIASSNRSSERSKDVSLERTVAMIWSRRSEISSKLRTEPLAWLLLDGVGLDGLSSVHILGKYTGGSLSGSDLGGSLSSLGLLASAILGQQFLVQVLARQLLAARDLAQHAVDERRGLVGAIGLGKFDGSLITIASETSSSVRKRIS